jgi:hypothetical protein
MSGTTGTQKSSVTLKVEIELGGMGNFTIDDCTSRAVTAAITVSFRLREESEKGPSSKHVQTLACHEMLPDVVTLSNNKNRNLGIHLQIVTSL